jgi:hypothetical protein
MALPSSSTGKTKHFFYDRLVLATTTFPSEHAAYKTLPTTIELANFMAFSAVYHF